MLSLLFFLWLFPVPCHPGLGAHPQDAETPNVGMSVVLSRQGTNRAMSHGLELLLAGREAGGCFGKIQHWAVTICVLVDGKHAALPGFPPKVTRTSQNKWEQAPGGIILRTEAKQDPQL